MNRLRFSNKQPFQELGSHALLSIHPLNSTPTQRKLTQRFSRSLLGHFIPHALPQAEGFLSCLRPPSFSTAGRAPAQQHRQRKWSDVGWCVGTRSWTTSSTTRRAPALPERALYIFPCTGACSIDDPGAKSACPLPDCCACAFLGRASRTSSRRPGRAKNAAAPAPLPPSVGSRRLGPRKARASPRSGSGQSWRFRAGASRRSSS